MRSLLILVALAGLCAADGGAFSDYKMVNKWAKFKAVESCYGEDVIKSYMLKMKKAYAKCTKKDMPEIELPMFASPYRAVQALLNGARDMESQNVERFQQLMKVIQQRTGTVGGNPLGAALQQAQSSPNYVPIPFAMPLQQPPNNNNNNDFMVEFMKKAFMRNMMKKFMGKRRDHDHDDDDDEDDFEDEDDFFDGDDERFAEMLFFRNKNNRRNRRQAQTDLYELGDRLSEKLMEQKAMMVAKMGNHSCILKELGLIDDDLELDLQSMLQEIQRLNIRDDWLLQRTIEDHRTCFAFAQSLPNRLINDMPMPEKFVKIKMFMKCIKMNKFRTCMNHDIKKKLEENFGPLSKLVDQTGMKENQLLPMAMKLLHGDVDLE